jgi:hypothetical protein
MQVMMAWPWAGLPRHQTGGWSRIRGSERRQQRAMTCMAILPCCTLSGRVQPSAGASQPPQHLVSAMQLGSSGEQAGYQTCMSVDKQMPECLQMWAMSVQVEAPRMS